MFKRGGSGVRGMFEFSNDKRPRLFQYGVSVFHINKPVQTFWNTRVRLEPRYSIFAITHFSSKGLGTVKSRKYFSIGMVADYQQGMQSHALTIAKELSSFFTFGMGYRRQYFFQADKHIESVIFQWMFTFDDWKIGASYDVTLSTLGIEKSGGTLEFGLIYTFGGLNLCERKKEGCPVKGFKIGHEVPKLSM